MLTVKLAVRQVDGLFLFLNAVRLYILIPLSQTGRKKYFIYFLDIVVLVMLSLLFFTFVDCIFHKPRGGRSYGSARI